MGFLNSEHTQCVKSLGFAKKVQIRLKCFLKELYDEFGYDSQSYLQDATGHPPGYLSARPTLASGTGFPLRI